MVVVGSVALFLAALLLRVRPTGRGRVGGVDAWFYLLYAEALRRQRRLPARLEQYLLDIVEQWYPPLFAMLLACLPAPLRVRAKDWVTPLIDLVHMGLAMALASALGAPPDGILMAGVVYAVMPGIVMEFSTLNSRSLGSILLSLAMVAAASQVESPGWRAVATTAAAGALVVLTHKMATQLLVPMFVALAITTARADLVLSAVLMFALAWVLTGGVYGRILRGHVAILRFWRRHLDNLNAHQVYDSPLYAVAASQRRRARRYFEPGFLGALRLLKVIVATNPFVIVLPWILATVPPTPISWTLAVWIVVTYVVVVTTTFVPALRFLGEGPKYLKFVALPQAVLTGIAASDGRPIVIAVTAAVLSLGVIWRLRNARTFEVIDDDLACAIAAVRADPRRRVASIPCHFCDALAYFTGKQVLWGAHSAGYEKLEEWFPIIRAPVETVLAKYDVDLLLVDREYVDPVHLRLGPEFRPILELPRLTLFERVAV